MKVKELEPQPVYYDCEEYDCDPVPTPISSDELYKIFDLSSDSEGEELQGLAEMMHEVESEMLKEPERDLQAAPEPEPEQPEEVSTFVQKEINRKKNRFSICNIV